MQVMCVTLLRATFIGLLLLAGSGVFATETWVVGPAPPALPLKEALARAQDGDTIAVMPGEYDGHVGVVTQRQLTIRGIGKRPVLRAGGKSAEDKAILVVRDGDITVENIEFRGARVRDGNGAGIRFERGRLTVRGCAFLDNENGLLTGNVESSELTIEDSLFAEAPSSKGLLPHLLYVGRIGKLTITGSRFHEGFEGHLIKSRAKETTIAYNLILDGWGGEASYEVDLPNGGKVALIGNVIGQGPRAQNRTLVAFGSEGDAWPASSLVMVHNTLLSPGWLPGRFVRSFTERLPKASQVTMLNNVLAGVALLDVDNLARFEGNVRTLGRWLRGPNSMDFALAADASGRQEGLDLAADKTLSAWHPRFEFTMPIGRRPLPPTGRLAPGALQ